jgi:ribose 5-phosphate isomerase B
MSGIKVKEVKKPRIAAGCDHAGYEYKESIAKSLAEQGYEVDDFGTFSTESTDYTDFAHAVATAIEKGVADFGILVCGSANGVAISANRHKKVRAAIAWRNDIAALARQHNNANIICIPSRFVTEEEAREFTNTFLTTPFEGGRHKKRVNKIEITY